MKLGNVVSSWGLAAAFATACAPALAQVEKGCAWIVEPTADRENILFPEVTTRYLAAITPVIPGGYLEITGQFPHARYMSLQTYTTALQTISNLADIHIAADPGSINPFLPGASRTALNRSYTVRVLDAHAQPEWRKYYNAPTGYTDMFTNNDVLGGINPTLREIAMLLPAGLGENADNKYVYTGLSREFGDVAVFRARKPVTPRTFHGEPTMGAGQMRFFSMCTGNAASQTYDCVVDKDVPVDRNGYFTLAVSPASARPANATFDCGVAWLPWGPAIQSTVILRNMLPDASFPHSVQAAAQGTEREVLGEYYPVGQYFETAADFEAAAGCHAPAAERAGSAAEGAGVFGGGSALDAALLLLLAAGGFARARRSA